MYFCRRIRPPSVFISKTLRSCEAVQVSPPADTVISLTSRSCLTLSNKKYGSPKPNHTTIVSPLPPDPTGSLHVSQHSPSQRPPPGSRLCTRPYVPPLDTLPHSFRVEAAQLQYHVCLLVVKLITTNPRVHRLLVPQRYTTVPHKSH